MEMKGYFEVMKRIGVGYDKGEEGEVKEEMGEKLMGM